MQKPITSIALTLLLISLAIFTSSCDHSTYQPSENGSIISNGESFIAYQNDDGISFALTSTSTTYVVKVESSAPADLIIPNKCPLGKNVVGILCINNSNLTSVTIPDTVIEIASGAFYGCTGLKTVNFAKNSQLRLLGTRAFENCVNLESIAIPKSVKIISTGAFYNCTNLKGVYFTNDSQLEIISEGAFQNCRSLTEINIPDNVTSIEGDIYNESLSVESDTKLDIELPPYEGAFGGCTNLKIVNFGKDSKLEAIGDKAFINCTNLIDFTIPRNVTSIGHSAFANCTSLISIHIPASVTSIKGGKREFVTDIPIDLPYNEYIPGAFEGCTNLSTVTFDDDIQLEAIDDYTFSNCTSLKSISIPQSVISINRSSFYNCTSLETLNFAENGRLNKLYKYALGGCTSLKSINIPSSVTVMDGGAFSGCTSLQNITFAENCQIKTLSSYVFENCKSLESITVPNSITSIIFDAFNGCSSLKNLNVANDHPTYTSIDGNLYSKNKDMLWIYAPGKTDSCFTIPTHVRDIDHYAFLNCKSLTALYITGYSGLVYPEMLPENITSVILAKNAFINVFYYGEFVDSNINICYEGTDSQFMEKMYEYPEGVLIYFYSEAQPTTEGNFWYYVDGKPAIWK